MLQFQVDQAHKALYTNIRCLSSRGKLYTLDIELNERDGEDWTFLSPLTDCRRRAAARMAIGGGFPGGIRC